MVSYLLVNKQEKKKRSISNRLVDAIIVSLFIVLVGFNYENLDYANYQNSYNQLDWRKGTEYLYEFLQRVFNSLNLGFSEFRLFLAIVSFLLLHLFLRHYTVNNKGFYLLYFFYPFFLDYIEIRNFLGMVIWLNGIRFLFDKKKWKIALYVAITIIAGLCQTTFLVFLPLALLSIKKERYQKALFCLFGFFAFLGIFIALSPSLTRLVVDTLYGFYSKIVGFDVRETYVEQIYTNYGYLVFVAEQLFIFGLMFLLNKETQKETNTENQDSIHYGIIKVAYFLSMYLLCFLPFFRVNGQFTRMCQISMPLFHVAILSFYRYSRIAKNTKKSILGLYILFVIYLFVRVLLLKHFDDIVLELFRKNHLWN